MGVVPTIVKFLERDDNPSLQREAAWALSNIAMGTSEDIEVIIQNGGVPLLCQLLDSGSDDVREKATRALSNFAGDSSQCRDVVLQCGALDLLVRKLYSKISVLCVTSWTLSNLFRAKPLPPPDMVLLALPTLVKLMHVDDQEVVSDASWALAYISDSSHE